jgi:hypothetical protein
MGACEREMVEYWRAKIDGALEDLRELENDSLSLQVKTPVSLQWEIIEKYGGKHE